MRPAGSVTKRSYGVSSGPISFLHVYNNAFGVIKQQGRHGSNNYLRFWLLTDRCKGPTWRSAAWITPTSLNSSTAKTKKYDSLMHHSNFSTLCEEFFSGKCSFHPVAVPATRLAVFVSVADVVVLAINSIEAV